MARRGKGKGKGKGKGGSIGADENAKPIKSGGKAVKMMKAGSAGSDDGGPGYDVVLALKKEIKANKKEIKSKKKEISTLKGRLTRTSNALAALRAHSEEIPALIQREAELTVKALANQLGSFECPITQEVPEEADCFFSLVDGRLYSLAAVKPWIEEKGTSP